MKSLFEELFLKKVLQIKILFHPFGRDLPKRYFPKYFCILIISFKKIAEIEDSNDDDVESDKICQKILSIQRLKNNVKIFYLFIFIITYNKVAEISKDISDDKHTENLFKKF